MDKILELQRKITPNRSILVAIYFTTLLLFSVCNLGLLGLAVFAISICACNIFPNLIPDTDKLEHFYWGLIFSIPVFVLWCIFTFTFCWILAPSLLFGGIKEIRDLFGYGKAELKDLLFTVYAATLIITTIKFT